MKTTPEDIQANATYWGRWAERHAADPPTRWEAANNRMVKWCSKRATRKRKAVTAKEKEIKERDRQEERKHSAIRKQHDI